jgi:hypothetical protein
VPAQVTLMYKALHRHNASGGYNSCEAGCVVPAQVTLMYKALHRHDTSGGYLFDRSPRSLKHFLHRAS